MENREGLPSGVVIRVVTDNNGVIPRSPSENTTVTNMVFDIANNSSFRDRSKRKNIADHEVSLLATKHKLAGVHTLGGDEELLLVFVPEGVAEGDSSQGRTTAWVVNDLGHNPLQVPIALSKIEGSKLGGALAAVGVGFEHGSRSLTLGSDNSTHFSGG